MNLKKENSKVASSMPKACTSIDLKHKTIQGKNKPIPPYREFRQFGLFVLGLSLSSFNFGLGLLVNYKLI